MKVTENVNDACRIEWLKATNDLFLREKEQSGVSGTSFALIKADAPFSFPSCVEISGKRGVDTIVMNILKNLIYTIIIIAGVSLSASAQKNNDKRVPPKEGNPPIVKPKEKDDKPKEKPREDRDKPKKPNNESSYSAALFTPILD